MPKLAANLSWIYQEVPFLQRFGAAAAHGSKAVEILLPYEAPAADIAAELKKHKLTQALFNLPAGDAGRGGRGVAAIPGCEEEVSAALDKALDYAKALECRTLHLLSGMIASGAHTKAIHKTLVSNLKKASDRTAKTGPNLLLGPRLGEEIGHQALAPCPTPTLPPSPSSAWARWGSAWRRTS